MFKSNKVATSYQGMAHQLSNGNRPLHKLTLPGCKVKPNSLTNESLNQSNSVLLLVCPQSETALELKF